MKVGDLVRYRSGNGSHNGWLGLIVREIPGHAEVKVIEWTHKNMGAEPNAANKICHSP